ncbi:hypothetical protein [Streptomyces tsukubensis]|uniref:hypothetical protein n=1 Tax=Streptomyces tsukubensis TaxID=83656 RepID=UPI00344F9346
MNREVIAPLLPCLQVTPVKPAGTGLPADAPRTGLPDAIWKVVARAATSAGDVGITYIPPGSD